MDQNEFSLIVDADCGVYDWICCHSTSDMARLLTLYDDLGRSRFMQLYAYVCKCKTTRKPPPPDEKQPNTPIIEPPDEKKPPPPGEGCALPPRRGVR